MCMSNVKLITLVVGSVQEDPGITVYIVTLFIIRNHI